MGARRWTASALGVLVMAGCAQAAEGAAADPVERPPVSTTEPTTTTTEAPATTTTVSTTVPPPPATTAPPTSTTGPHPARVVVPQAWVPYASAGPVLLHHPSDRVEAIGFHQSAQDGAQPQAAMAGAVRWFTMPSRERDTAPTGAADIVVEPDRGIRSPVTGTVLRAATYTLYCDHVDQVVVIEPDSRPGWQVKVLHIEGVNVGVGQRVEAGVTPIAGRARVLPFPSQVEDHTGLPAWPHVHVEVIDPTIPDRPTGPGCP